jgi:hypothetical protein
MRTASSPLYARSNDHRALDHRGDDQHVDCAPGENGPLLEIDRVLGLLPREAQPDHATVLIPLHVRYGAGSVFEFSTRQTRDRAQLVG